MPVKAVLFDLGLTLTKTSPFPEIYQRILNHFGVKVPIEHIVRAQKLTESEFDATEYPVNRREEYWTEYNASLLKKLGVEEKRVFLAEKIDKLWWEYSHLQVFPDVKPTLFQLKAKDLKLGIISNSFKRDLKHVLKKLQLEQWFDLIVSMDSCNCAKPAKEIFLYALNKLRVKPVETFFVGDSMETDYKGAMAVGITPFIIDREGKVPSQYNKIESLTDLVSIV